MGDRCQVSAKVCVLKENVMGDGKRSSETEACENFKLKQEMHNMDMLICNVAPGLSKVPVYILDDLEDINLQVKYT